MAMRESGGGISEPQGPPYPIGSAQARWEAVGQIYGRVDGKEPPAHNIVSEALWAYYTRVDRQTLNMWACQVLCMIAEYHMAFVTRGSPITSPLVLTIAPVLLMFESGIIGPRLCEWPYGATAWI